MCLRPLFALLTFTVGIHLHAQQDEQRLEPTLVGFYNIENLFDTLDSPGVIDEEYLPSAPKQWGTKRYFRKVEKMAGVIASIGTDVHPEGLSIVGLCEIENSSVLEDLVAAAPLRERKMKFVHQDGPDRRGVDCALLYNPAHFKLISFKSYPLIDPNDPEFLSRDQLLVSGVLHGDTAHFIVNHWPSRRGGEKRSQPKRALAGALGRRITDSLLTAQPHARIFYMGDLNDDPVDRSVTKSLGSSGVKADAKDGKYYNPMFDLYRKGIGSLAWQDAWNLFDQILVSPAVVHGHNNGFKLYAARVFNQPHLRQKTGNFAGYPFRTFVGDQYMDGYSDHFPVYLVLVRAAR